MLFTLRVFGVKPRFLPVALIAENVENAASDRND